MPVSVDGGGTLGYGPFLAGTFLPVPGLVERGRERLAMTGSVLRVPHAGSSAARRRRPGGWRLAIAAAPVAALAVAMLPSGSAAAAPTTPGVPPPPHGWKTLFKDNFNGPA